MVTYDDLDFDGLKFDPKDNFNEELDKLVPAFLAFTAENVKQMLLLSGLMSKQILYGKPIEANDFWQTLHLLETIEQYNLDNATNPDKVVFAPDFVKQFINYTKRMRDLNRQHTLDSIKEADFKIKYLTDGLPLLERTINAGMLEKEAYLSSMESLEKGKYALARWEEKRAMDVLKLAAIDGATPN